MAEPQMVVRRKASPAQSLSEEIVKNYNKLGAAWVLFRRKLLRFDEIEGWKDMGFANFHAWARDKFPDADPNNIKRALRCGRVEQQLLHAGAVDTADALSDNVLRELAKAKDDAATVYATAKASPDGATGKSVRDVLEARVPPPKDETIVDGRGDDVEYEELQPVFGVRQQLLEAVKAVSLVQRTIKNTKDTPGGACLALGTLAELTRALKKELKRTMPYCQCLNPDCKWADGGECVACESRGWVTEDMYRRQTIAE